MSDISKLRAALNQKEAKPPEFKAVLGRADGTVKATDETVYVTLYNGNVIEVFNERVPLVAFRKIKIGYDNKYPNLLQVLAFDDVYDSHPLPHLPNHKDSHLWYKHDPIEVYMQQVMQLLPRPVSGMTIRVYGGEYYCNGVVGVFNTTDIDMTSEMPVSGAEWVNAEIDNTGAITFRHGTNRDSRESLMPSDIPIPEADRKMLFSVKMYPGLTNFIQTRIDTDIFDPRLTGIVSGTSSDIYPRVWLEADAPTIDDDYVYGYRDGDIWIDQTNDDAYILLDAGGLTCIECLEGTAVWYKINDGLTNPVNYIDFNLAGDAAPETQGRLSWNPDELTLNLGMGNDITAQLAHEIFFDVKNQTGANITNGTPVMFAGTVGASGRTLIQKAIADGSLSSEYIMGIVTHDIDNGDDGKVTWFGKVRGIDTSGTPYGETWADGDLLYVSQDTAGYLTNVEPTSGQKILVAAVVYADDNAGTLLVRPTWDGHAEEALHENYYPHRWLPNLAWEYAAVSIVSTTKLKITLTATATNLGYYWRGEKVDLGATTLEVTSTDDKAEGIWYCYSRDGVTFELNQTPFYIWDIVSGARRADLMVWEFYWDNTNNTTLWIQPEFHSMLNPAIHGYAHEAFGTRYANGLAITYGTTASNNDTRVKFTSGEIHDEDISAYITHAAAPDDIWEQILGSAGTADENYAALPIFYLSGATPVWRKETANSYPFRPVSNNYIYRNRLNAGSYDYSTGISVNNYVVYWIVGTTNQTEPIVAIPGRLDNATLTAAQAEAFPDLSGLFTEYKLLYRIIYRGLAANSNNGKCQIISVTDYRRDNISNNAVSSGATSAALVSFTPSGGIAATNVQAAIEELDTETVKLSGDQTIADVKTFSSFPVTPSSAPTTDYQVANKKYVDDNAGGGGGAFQRVLTADLTLADGESLVVSDYIDGNGYDLTLEGDAALVILSGRDLPARSGSATSSATPTINTDVYDSFELTAQAVDITSMTTNLSGTPIRNQTLLIVITGTAARAITWGASFENGSMDLPTTTVTTETLEVMLRWNEATSKWRCMAWSSA